MSDDENGPSRAETDDAQSRGDDAPTGGDDPPSGSDGAPTGGDDPTAPTTRQRILERLREGPATPSALGNAFSLPPSVALDHVRHVARSLDGSREGAGGNGGGASGDSDGGSGEELLVRPPACRECGFDAFDDRLNRPSRCPECRSERIREPAFLVE